MSRAGAMAVVLGIAAAAFASCGGSDAGGLAITNAYITTSPTDIAALYFTVENDGGEDTLLGVSTDAAGTISFHQNVVDGASSRMEPRERIPIPANASFAFRPGDYHVMLEQLQQPLVPGSTLELTAEFAHAGARPFTAEVRGIGAADHTDGH